ncbi:MAG TPA: kynureninase [Terriglobales bacterium]
MTDFKPTAAFAREMDARDPLAEYRDQFYFPKAPDGNDCLYLCGHSLGLQPKNARKYVDEVLSDWARLGVEGHFRSGSAWLPYHRFLTDQTARLVGATPQEVVVMNSLTVNLHLMMVSFYRPTPQRHKIVIESGAFPSDQYAVKSQILFHGFDPSSSLIELTPRRGEFTIRDEDIQSLIETEGQSIALIMLGGVNYATGQLFDMASITSAGHAKGCVVAFDLAHAAGNVPLKLHDWNVDFAVWCTYKYLNGGPGCVAGCFVHESHAKAWTLPRFAGWWGHDESIRFQMGPDFQPTPGAEGWQLSNPPILSMAALRASMDLFDAAGMPQLRAKSLELTGYLEFLLSRLTQSKFEIITPRDPQSRGAQLSLRMADARRAICDQLLEVGVVCDWRQPDLLRAGLMPLYNSFQDAYRFVEKFSAILG